MTMSGLGVVEWLRPLVDTKAWDYVVVWKYGDDPTRFIEWMGCCCGGNIELVKTKAERDEQYQCHLFAPICRDTLFRHPVRTKTCEALAKLPFAMSLYSGVHGEVAISQQPRWLIHENSIGTQVLIPILGGLVELFTAKLIPKDINIIEFITAHCCVSIKQEAISGQSYTSLKNFNEHHTSTPGFHMHAENKCSSNPSIEEPSSGSNQKQSVKTSPIPKTKKPKYNEASGKCERGLSSHCGNGEEDEAELVRKPQKEGYYHAKNLVTERNRRNRIKKGLFALRSLVPKITKMDRAAILADAIDYIKELQRQEKELQEEVRALEVQDYEKNTLQLGMPTDKEQEGTRRGSVPLTELNQSSSDYTKKTQMKVQAEVYHIGRTDFLIKLCSEKKQGGFTRLMEAIHSYGLHVANANMTTFDGKVLNVLTVEATEQDIHPTKLREYLIQQTR